MRLPTSACAPLPSNRAETQLLHFVQIFSAKLGSGPNLPVEQAPCREVHAPGQLMADDIRKKYPNLFQSAQSVGSSGQALGNLELDMNDNNGTVDGFALHTGQGHDIGECGVSPTHSVLSFLEDSSRESDAPSIGRVMAFVDDGSRGIQDLPFLSQESRVQSLICNSLMTDGTAEEQAGASEPPAVSMAFAQPLSQAAEAVAEYYKTLDELSDLVSGLLVKLSPGPLRPLGKGALPDSKEVPAGTVSAMQRLPELCNSSLHASSADLMESISEEAVHSRSNISVTSNGNVSSVSSMAGTHGMFLRGHLDVHLPCDGRPPANLSDLEAVAHGPDHYRRGLHAGFTNDCILGPMLDVVESPVRHGNFVTTNSPSFKALYYSQATVMLPGLSTNDSSAQIHPPPDTRETMKWEPVPPNVEVLSPWACLDDKSWYSTSESRESPSCYSRSLSLQHSTAQPQQFSFSIVTSSAEKPPICKTLSVANQEP